MDAKAMLVDWLDHESWASRAMLEWFATVPADRKAAVDYAQAVNLVGHVVACRQNWLDRIVGAGGNQVSWWPTECNLDSLSASMEAVLQGWREFIVSSTPQQLESDFEYVAGEATWKFNIQLQAMQMVGHGFYHRGQVALLIAQLGGEPKDTDFLYYKLSEQPDRWGMIGTRHC